MKPGQFLGWGGNEDAGLGFSEEGSVPPAFDVKAAGEAEAAEDAGLGQGDCEPAVGAVVGGGYDAIGDGPATERLDFRFQGQVNGGIARHEAVA